MNLAASVRALASSALDPNNRPARLNFGPQRRALEQTLLLQRVDINEGLMSGLHGVLTCVSTQEDLSEKKLLGVPLGVQIVTDRGQMHTINGIVTQFRRGQSDGGLTVCQLTLADGLSVMEKRRNSRVFLNTSLPDILHEMLVEWRRRSPTLAQACEFDVSGLDRNRYPKRTFVRQDNETDAGFIQRLLRRDGVTWFVKSGRPSGAQDDAPVHTLVFCDDPMRLSQCAAGTVRYHPRDAATEMRDSITYWSWLFELVAGRAGNSSWDYKSGQIHQAEQVTAVDQGDAGNDLAHLLSDSVIDVPHAFDSWDDHDRIAHDRMLAHEGRAARIDGISGVRDLAVGCWFELANHPVVDAQASDKRQFITTSLHHHADNNLPKELDAPVTALLDASQLLFSAHTGSRTLPEAAITGGRSDTRYQNAFSCVRRGVPLTPAYDPAVDLPPDHLITGVIVGPQGEEVFIDALGRVRVQIQGLNPDDHEHAQGAGTNGDPGDSAPVRVACALAGDGFGMNIPLRVGMEVLLATVGGDPDKLVIIGVLSSGTNPPARFSQTGSLPGNRYLSGMTAREVKGSRINQFRLDSTPGEISSQLASDHASSELNLGFNTQPRDGGHGAARGEGAELRSDARVAIRGGKGMLISAWEQFRASGDMLARDECVQMMQECLELFKSLGDYAGQHQGVAMDTKPQEALAGAIKGWPQGTSKQDSAGASGAAIAITSPAGVSTVTPKTVTTHAGVNVDTVALENLQCTSGQQMNFQAGHGVATFAQGGDISMIANQGKVTVQSQTNDTEIDSAKNIKLTAAGGKLVGMASGDINLITSGGAYIKLSGANVEIGCPGQFVVKAAGHTWAGAASMSTDMPSFDHSPLGRTPKLVRPTDGQAVQGMQAEVTKASGELVKGQSDAAGKLAPIQGSQFENLAVNFFKNKA
jgi:type VI secretion system secreted protein VgrG